MYNVYYLDTRYQFRMLNGKWLMEEYRVKEGQFRLDKVVFNVNDFNPFREGSSSKVDYLDMDLDNLKGYPY